MRLDQDELHTLVAKGREQRVVEFKAAGTWDQYEHKIVKGALAFSNLEGGGYMIIGVREDGPHDLTIEGVSGEEANSFEYDQMSSVIDNYADPYVDFDVYPLEAGNGERVVVIDFEEFDDIPVIAKQDYPDANVREGGVYYRDHRRIETAAIAGHADMRELLDLATRKKIRQWHRHAEAVESASDSETFYDDELGEL